MDSYICEMCGFEYDPEVGHPESDVAAGTSWDKVPEDWVCPVCDAGKEAFEVA